MSESGMQNRGRPDAQLDSTHFIVKYCGGSGGGGCTTPLTGTQVSWLVKVSKNVVYNRRIVIENPEFYGIRLWNDAGFDGLCSHSLGVVEHSFFVSFSADGVLSDDEIRSNGVELSGAVPYTFDIPFRLLPQPILPEGGPNPDWAGSLYIHVLHDSNGLLMNESVDGLIGEGSLRIVKHDMDTHQ